MPTSNQHTDVVFGQIEKHLPVDRVEPAEPYLRGKARQLGEVRAAADTAIALTDRTTSPGRWLDLLMEGYGIHRSTDETDPQLRNRATQFARGVVTADLIAITNELLEGGTGAELVEWYQRGPALGVQHSTHGFILGRSRLQPMGGFLIVVPDTVANKAAAASIVARINGAKKNGARWFLCYGPYYPGDAPVTFNVLTQGGDQVIDQLGADVIHQG